MQIDAAATLSVYPTADSHRQVIRFHFEILAGPAGKPAPVFVFAHIISPLAANYLPGVDSAAIPPAITPVNLFRIVFNEDFDAGLAVLLPLGAAAGKQFWLKAAGPGTIAEALHTYCLLDTVPPWTGSFCSCDGWTRRVSATWIGSI